MKKFWGPVFFAVIAFTATTGFAQAVLLGATVSRTVSPDTIYYEGAGPIPTEATVTIKGWADDSGDVVGSPADVMLMLDRSSSMSCWDQPGNPCYTMGGRVPGDNNTAFPLSRIQGAFNAMTAFVKDHLIGSAGTRASFLALADNPLVAGVETDYCVLTPYENVTQDPGFANLLASIDQNTVTKGWADRPCAGSSEVWDGLHDGIDYALANKRAGVTPVFILISDAQDFSDENSGQAGANSVVARLNSLNDPIVQIQVFTVVIGAGDTANLRAVALAGKGLFGFSETGTDLGAIFDSIGVSILTQSGVVQVNATTPLFMDVLGPNIHYVPGSWAPQVGPGRATPSGFVVDTVQGLTRLQFYLPTLSQGDTLWGTYRITAALTIPNVFTATPMPTNNKSTDPLIDSRVSYLTKDSTTGERKIPPANVYVKSVVGGLFISTLPNTFSAPAPISVDFTVSQPGVWPPTDYYALLGQFATNTSSFSPVPAQWFYTPNVNWTGSPALLGVASQLQNISITAPFPYADQMDIVISFTLDGVAYFDTLHVAAKDSSDPESIIGVVIDEDIVQANGYINPPRIEIKGDTSSLPGFTKILYGIHITDRSRYLNLPVTWSASGFSVYDIANGPSAINGLASIKTLAFTDMPIDTFPQSDSGTITIIDTGGSSYTLTLIITDTTDYDTVDVMAITPDSAFQASLNLDQLYDLYYNQVTYSPRAGDTLVLAPLLFDNNRGDVKNYLANGTFRSRQTVWTVNGVVQASSSTLTYTKGVPGSRDTLVATFGGTISDTIFIDWGFGRLRFLHIENKPAQVVPSTANPDPVTTIIFNAAPGFDTVYAVIRDEYNFAITNAPLEIWSWGVNDGYLTGPTGVITSVFDITKLKNGTSTITIPLIAQVLPTTIAGVSFAQALTDTVLISIFNFEYTGLRIRANGSATNTQGGTYSALWDEIPAGDTLLLVALEDTTILSAQLFRNDNNTWGNQPVSWTLSDFSWLTVTSFPALDSIVTLIPTSNAAGIVTLIATSGTNADTVYLKIEPARIDSFGVSPPPYLPQAGDTNSLTITALDGLGNTVTDPSRQPTEVCFDLVGDTITIIIDSQEVVITNRYCFPSPFENGVLNAEIIGTIAGDVKIQIEITYPGGEKFITDWDFTVIPGDPALVRMVYAFDSALVSSDTLSSHGALVQTQATYLALLYDAYGNLITNPVVTGPVVWSFSAGNLDTSRLSSSGNSATFNALDLPGASSGTITASIPGIPGVVGQFQLVVIPLVGIASISTHEWVADTSTMAGVAEIDLVLNVVLPGINPFTNLDKLTAVRNYGYQSFRDGFLDYLDITFLGSFNLSVPVLNRIIFRGGTDSVLWALSDTLGNGTVRAVKVVPMDTAGEKFRIWLLTNANKPTAPTETGFRPVITFDNVIATALDVSSGYPVLIGDGLALYTTLQGVTFDSAAPVIDRFTLKNNACNASNQNNVIKIFFSEPVRTIPGDNLWKKEKIFTLENSGAFDSSFVNTATQFLELQQKLDISHPLLAWEKDDDNVFSMSIGGSIKFTANALFTPFATRIMFWNNNRTPVMDKSGNVATNPANRLVTLTPEGALEAICSVNGNTVADRVEASHYAWFPEPGTGDPVPGFPYFGFTLNLSAIDPGAQNHKIDSCAADNYVVFDFDSNFAFATVDVWIYDLFGNVVATPESHDSALSRPYTLKEVREYLEISPYGACGKSLADLKENFNIIKALNSPIDPDTLRPRYPATLAINYDFLLKNCGPSVAVAACIPSWNALNSKGRLVAPGGYIARQVITLPGKVEEIIRKVIITSKAKLQ